MPDQYGGLCHVAPLGARELTKLGHKVRLGAAGCGAGRRASVRSYDAGMQRSLSRSSAQHCRPSSPAGLGKPFALPLDPIVASRHELLLDLPKFGSHALGHWLPSEHEAAAIPPGLAVMLEP